MITRSGQTAADPPVPSAMLSPGDSFSLILTTPASEAVATTATVQVGSTTTSWSVATGRRSPDPFAVPDVQNAPFGTEAFSSTVTAAGYTLPTTISITGDGAPRVSVQDGAWVTSSALPVGAQFRVKLAASPTPGEARSATMTIGSTQSTWRVVTAASNTPTSFSFSSKNYQPQSALVTSDNATLTFPPGATLATPVSVSGDGNPRISIAGGAWSTSGTLTPGQTLAVQLTTHPEMDAPRTATVTVGGASAPFTATTMGCAGGYEVVTASRDFVPPSGCGPLEVRVLAVGAGAGGEWGARGGGGSGYVAMGAFTVTGPIPVTIGNGGTGGTQNTRSTAGGATTFGSSTSEAYLTAAGGPKTPYPTGEARNGGNGGSGGGGQHSVGGSNGSNGSSFTTSRGVVHRGGTGAGAPPLSSLTRLQLTPGAGGVAGEYRYVDSRWGFTVGGGGGGGGIVIPGYTANGAAGTTDPYGGGKGGGGGRGYGGGGGGGAGNDASSNNDTSGGTGAKGVVYVEW